MPLLFLFSSFSRSYERLLSRDQLIESQRSAHARTYSRGRARRIAAQPQEIRAVIHASWCRNRPRGLATAFAHVDDPRSFRLFRACHCLERPANSLISRGGHRLIQQPASRWSADDAFYGATCANSALGRRDFSLSSSRFPHRLLVNLEFENRSIIIFYIYISGINFKFNKKKSIEAYSL